MNRKHISLAVLLANLTVISFATAETPHETWTTEAVCDGKKFIIESHCTASMKEMELNDCSPDQTLSNGAKKIRIPATRTSKAARHVFAYSWACAKVQDKSYLTISYSAESGRREEDELEEALSLDLTPVRNDSLEINIYRAKRTGTKGLIRSIFPD